MNHPVEKWWTERQLVLVEDRAREWHRNSFEASPAFDRLVSGTRVLGKAPSTTSGVGAIADGWDHEHGELCWSKIARAPGDGIERFTNGDKWLCVPCFAEYVQPRRAA